MPCPSCGWQNPLESRYCNQCGSTLAVLTAAPRRPMGLSAGAASQIGVAVPGAARPVREAAAADWAVAALQTPLVWAERRLKLFAAVLRQPVVQAVIWGMVLIVALIVLGPTLWDSGMPWLRRELNRIPHLLGFAAALALVATFVFANWGARLRSRQLWRQGGIVLAIAMAAIGQGLILAGHIPPGAILYILAFLVAGVYAWGRTTDAALLSMGLNRWEPLLLIVVIGVGAFTRLWMIGAYPYGYEGDESMWTWNTVFYMLAGEGNTWPILGNIRAIPATFWIEAATFRLFGPSIDIARIVVAIMSILGNVAFYFMARRCVPVPAALLATFLLGISITDVSASRLADPEGQIKLWATLAPMFLLWALESRRSLLFLLCGLSLAGGMLTYDTYYPIAAAVGLYALIYVGRRWRETPRFLPGLSILALTVAAVGPFVVEMVRMRLGVYTGIVRPRTELASQDLWSALVNHLLTGLSDILLTIFVRQRWGDFLVNRDGGILNAVLVPLLVIGFGVVVVQFRVRHNLFLILWVLLALFPAPILTGATYVRVLYAAYPVLYVLIGLALWWSYTALKGQAEASWGLRLRWGLVGFLALLGVFNTYIYFREVRDFDDRMHRRELGDEVAAAVGDGGMTYVVFQPLRGDFIAIERPFIRLAVVGEVGLGHEVDYYRHLPYEELLPRIYKERSAYAWAQVISEGPQRDLGADRTEVLQSLTRCFPDTARRDGKYVSVYTIPEPSLRAPACAFDAQARLVGPLGEVSSSAPVEFAWAIEQGDPQTVRLQVDRINERVLRIEGETFGSSERWGLENRYVGEFTGSGYLADEFLAGRAVGQFDVPVDGSYQVWVRWYRRIPDPTRVYLEIGGRQAELARSEAATLDRWVWESLGSYQLPAGSLSLAFRRDYADITPAMHRSIFIDSLALSRDPGFNPSQADIWTTVLDVHDLPARTPTYRSPNGALPPGQYRWRIQLLAGERLVDPWGRRGLWTPNGEFRITS